jgi:hypothetical protein
MMLFDDVHISLVPPSVSLEAGGGTLVVELKHGEYLHEKIYEFILLSDESLGLEKGLTWYVLTSCLWRS